jgi:pilus assembly protein CpaF
MFAIIITEKGGTERREVFDRTEINVGRVQGNELMLPKGNVSKHHARLLYRDGRFIVTDLKSTNGTYVNGRKITQATIVREGDKIYVGDFILRLEIPLQQAPAQLGAPEEAVDHTSSPRNLSPQEGLASRPPVVRPGQEGPINRYPLEGEPDEQSWSSDEPKPEQTVVPTIGALPPLNLRMPAPPRVPSSSSSARDRRSSSSRAGGPNMPPAAPPTAPDPTTGPTRPSSPSTGPRASLPREATGHGTQDSMQVPAQRIAAIALVTRVEGSVDLAPLDGAAQPPKPLLDRIDRALRDAAGAMRAAGEIPPQVDVEAAIGEARDELIGIGPLLAWLADEDVVQIHIHRHGWVSTLRASGPRRTETPFASEAALDRILRRLCAREGAPVEDGELTVERHLQNGMLHLLALFAPVAHSGSVATIRKCAQSPVNLDDLVRCGAMSRALASFLAQVVAGRANLLLNACTRSDMYSLLGAALSAVRPNEHLVVAHGPTFGLALPRNATGLVLQPGEQGAEALRAAARLAPDRLVVAGFDGAAATELLDAVASGAQGVMVATQAPTVRHALARMVPDFAAHRPGLPVEALREWVNASFDVAVEYARMRDGRTRVVRVSEPAGVEGRVITMRDIFTFHVERTASGGAVEGSFHPTGVVPRIAEDLQARGLSLDPSLFRR